LLLQVSVSQVNDEVQEINFVDSDNYIAPVFEIDRRRNFAIISHPDAGMCHIFKLLKTIQPSFYS
jgi:hypothetical protein